MTPVLIALAAATSAVPPGAIRPAPLLPLTFNLPEEEPTLAPAPVVAEPAPTQNPLVLPLLDDDRQQLLVGIRPDGGPPVGVAYRLTLGS